MKKNYGIFIGVDVSKVKLDYCIIDKESMQYDYGSLSNTAKGINAFLSLLSKKLKGNKEDILFCLENTGVYSMPICYWLQTGHFDYWVVPALEIRRSKGIVRGKTDKADSRDIALYAISHLHELKLSHLPEKYFVEIRLLLAERDKVVKAISIFNMTKESKNFLPEDILKITLQHNKRMMIFLKKQLLQIEKSIENIINSNPLFKQQDELLQSIPGVGKQTSVLLIAYTQAFTLFKTHRQFACYAGVAPFEYSSGSSVRGRTKVSNLANKRLKTALNMAALTAKKFDLQLKQYYESKVEAGKNKMLVLNAIRCKIISRAFAVINRNSKFVDTLKAVA
ncbi:transposase [Microcoleus sp. B3-D2]|jgi:transposase|uniref:transposase n=1 Tax=Microcoleus sp. B3-D2 TaxID=2818655 RepID=UPI002FD560F6